MNWLPITPLEAWTCRKIGLPDRPPLDRHRLADYQLAAFNRTLAHVRRNSPFYRRHLHALPAAPLSSLTDLTKVPLTTPDDLRRDPDAFVCVSRDRIARAVTLATTGTTGRPKRLFFTAADLAATVDFFRHGMGILVTPGQRVLILLPGTSPGSVGDLLAKALGRMDVTGIVHGPVSDPQAAIACALREKADCLVGIPVQVLSMACHPEAQALAGQIQSVLLSTDYVPDALVARLEQAWQCMVYKHYGMTEMGLGGAVECAARDGYHFRECDLLVEIIDPRSTRPLPDGTAGEIVFTTLTREGMPLIRYRTGDLAAFRVDPCPCGALLKTLGKVQGRMTGAWHLRSAKSLFIGDLDEVMFGIPEIVNYTASVEARPDGDMLRIGVEILPGTDWERLADHAIRAVRSLSPIGSAVRNKLLELELFCLQSTLHASTGAIKRQFSDQHKRNPRHANYRTDGL